MSDQEDGTKPEDALDELVTQLLGCGGVLSQVINHMVQFEASGQSVPGTTPVPEVAHSLIRDVILEPTQRYSEGEIRAAAVIIEKVTNAICEEIFIVDPSLNGTLSRGCASTRRSRRGRGDRRR